MKIPKREITLFFRFSPFPALCKLSEQSPSALIIFWELRDSQKPHTGLKISFLSDSEANFALPYYTLFTSFFEQKMVFFKKSSFCHEFTNPDPDMVLACFKSFQMDSGGLREAGIIAWISATLAKTDSPSRNLWILLRKGISSWNRMRWAEIGGVSGLFNLSGHGEWLPCFRLFTEIFSAGHVLRVNRIPYPDRD